MGGERACDQKWQRSAENPSLFFLMNIKDRQSFLHTLSMDDLPFELKRRIVSFCDGTRRDILRETCISFREAVESVASEDPPKVSDVLSSPSLVRWAARRGLPLTANTFALAAISAPLSSLRELRELGCKHDSRVCFQLCRRGDVDALRWAKEQGLSWNYLSCAAASALERAEVLTWLGGEGVSCPCGGTYHPVAQDSKKKQSYIRKG